MPDPRSPLHVAFGNALRKIRRRRDFSQEEMALRAEMGRSYAGGIERGERNASLTNLGKLARALEIPLSELFRMAEEELARAETKGRADG